MVGGCIHGALQLSFIEIRATGFNLPHFWQNTALMVAETLLSPFQGTKQYECRGLCLQRVCQRSQMVVGCTCGAPQLSFIEIKAKGGNLARFRQNTALMLPETF